MHRNSSAVDASSSTAHWSDRYDHGTDYIFAAQYDIAENIAGGCLSTMDQVMGGLTARYIQLGDSGTLDAAWAILARNA
jgi:hypothetical protein